MTTKMNSNENFKIVAKNRRAKFDYEIIDTLEAGIILTGSEVKSIRNGKVSINESFIGAMANSNDIYLFNSDIAPYVQASYNNHEPKRPRVLLLHKVQRAKLLNAIQKKGMTLIPL
ncbi:MAG: SsrA-binding protein SmpB, partial [Alphaproteobacteria bacterium]|nr:SsrA-binding protein SmpB [Alphaproteobacteria bacterium]